MRDRSRGRKLLGMSTPDPKQLTLKLDPWATPIRGELIDAQGARQPFSGWLGLAAALEQHLEPDVETTPTEKDHHVA